jgi:uncharacterized protein YecE (DUF72 family)
MYPWRIGCSGFYYSEWKGIFYPESIVQRKWFEYYCDHFNAVELNVTFYRFPKLEFFQSWYNRSPENFTFSIKAPRVITHYKRFTDAQLLINDFYERVAEGLKEKAGSVLFQFPASFSFDDEALEKVVSLLNKSFVNVLEFRHPSWWQQKVYDVLTQNNIAFCGMSHPALPENIIMTSNTVYYRFHGIPELYHSMYKTNELQQVIDRITNFENVEQVCLYFNNTATGAAIINAKELQEYCQLLPVNK